MYLFLVVCVRVCVFVYRFFLSAPIVFSLPLFRSYSWHPCRVLSRVGGPGFPSALVPFLFMASLPGLVAGGRAGLPISACCPGAVRPAVRCPAAGEGLRGRLRRSAGKLTPNDYVYGIVLPYCWQRTKFRTNQRHICGWQLGPYKVILGLFFLLARILISCPKSARTRDQWLSPTFCLSNSAPS